MKAYILLLSLVNGIIGGVINQPSKYPFFLLIFVIKNYILIKY